MEVNGWQAQGTRSAFDHDARKGLALLKTGLHIGTVTSNMADAEAIGAVSGLLAMYAG